MALAERTSQIACPCKCGSCTTCLSTPHKCYICSRQRCTVPRVGGLVPAATRGQGTWPSSLRLLVHASVVLVPQACPHPTGATIGAPTMHCSPCITCCNTLQGNGKLCPALYLLQHVAKAAGLPRLGYSMLINVWKNERT